MVEIVTWPSSMVTLDVRISCASVIPRSAVSQGAFFYLSALISGETVNHRELTSLIQCCLKGMLHESLDVVDHLMVRDNHFFAKAAQAASKPSATLLQPDGLSAGFFPYTSLELVKYPAAYFNASGRFIRVPAVLWFAA